jgi:hypothetical protein
VSSEQKAEIGNQKSEIRNQKSEVRSQKSEDKIDYWLVAIRLNSKVRSLIHTGLQSGDSPARKIVEPFQRFSSCVSRESFECEEVTSPAQGKPLKRLRYVRTALTPG